MSHLSGILSAQNLHEELLPDGRIVEGADVVHGEGVGILLGHTAHLHAEVARLNHNHHTEWVEGLVDGLCYLVREAFLHLEAVAEGVDHTCQFAQAGDLPVGDVGNVYMPEEG